jgi:hypothetical protein
MTNHMLQGGANSDHQKGPNQVDETNGAFHENLLALRVIGRGSTDVEG